jgi:hypothetical protein
MPYFDFFITDSLEKVFPDSRPCPLRKMKITALAGEKVSFQIVYSLEDPTIKSYLQHFQVYVKGVPVPVRMRSVELVPSQYPCTSKRDKNYLRTAPGLFPDLLLPSNGRILPVDNQYRSLWIDLILENIDAGTYFLQCGAEAEEKTVLGNGTYRISGNEFNWEEQIELEVVPAELGPQTLIHTEWFHADCLAQYYDTPSLSEEHWRIMENFIKAAHDDCGINMLLTPIFTPPLDTAVGGERTTVQLVSIKKTMKRYSFDFTDVRRWCRICQKYGISYLEMSHLFTQWGAKATPKILVEVNGKMEKAFGWDVEATSPEYRLFLESFIPALIVCLKEEGYDREHVFFHISDEPDQEQLESYLAAKNQVSDLLSNSIIIDALSSYEFFKQGVVSHPVPSNDHIQAFIDHDVPDLWVYYCVAQGVDVPNRFFSMSSSRNRIMGVLMYLYDIKGFLHWGFNFYNTSFSTKSINPFITTDCGMAFPSGDPFLVYPAPDGTIYSSIRNEVQMEAFQDLKALQLLESKIGRNAVVDLVLDGDTKPFTFTEYPCNKEYFISLRERINAKIKGLG